MFSQPRAKQRYSAGDTPAKLVYGDYPAAKSLQITLGYNKERRRKLKQFKIGLGTNPDGYPVSGGVLDGNLGGKNWNKVLLSILPEHFI